jgi:hypothetical protein
MILLTRNTMRPIVSSPMATAARPSRAPRLVGAGGTSCGSWFISLMPFVARSTRFSTKTGRGIKLRERVAPQAVIVLG